MFLLKSSNKYKKRFLQSQKRSQKSKKYKNKLNKKSNYKRSLHARRYQAPPLLLS